jgi:hypothetical protein
MPDNLKKRAPRAGAPRRVDVLVALAVVAVASAAVAGLSWSRPASITPRVGYQQSGQLTYSAPTPPTSVYGNRGLVTGEPVYTSSVRALAIRYAYAFASTAESRLHGTEQLTATVSNGSGLYRDVALQPRTPFAGNHFATTVTLRLSAIQAIVKAFAEASGGDGSGNYPVTVAPQVRIRGQLAGEPFSATFRRPTMFDFSSSTLSPVSASTGSASPATTRGPSTGPLVVAVQGSVAASSSRSAMLVGQVPVRDARVASLLLLLASLAALIALGRPLLKDATSRIEHVRIATRYGSSLVDVVALPESAAVVELSSFEGLAQVGRRLECPLLHRIGDGMEEYAVVDNGTLYRYVSADTARTVGDGDLAVEPRWTTAGDADASRPSPATTNGRSAPKARAG